MKYYGAVLLLLIAFGTYAQQSKVSVTFCPLAAADVISFPTIQAGLEYKPAGHFSLYNEFGVEYLPSGVDRADTVILRPHGIKAKTELRYYFGPESYFAVNAFLTSDAHNTGTAYFDALNPLTLQTTSFGVHKNVLGWNVLYGWKESLGGRFWIDCYAGVGMRFRYIRTVDDQLNGYDRVPLSIDEPNLPSMQIKTDMTGGWSTAPNFTLGVRLVYRFGRIIKDDRPPPHVRPPVLGSQLDQLNQPHPLQM
jgi:hypothetical protein